MGSEKSRHRENAECTVREIDRETKTKEKRKTERMQNEREKWREGEREREKKERRQKTETEKQRENAKCEECLCGPLVLWGLAETESSSPAVPPNLQQRRRRPCRGVWDSFHAHSHPCSPPPPPPSQNKTLLHQTDVYSNSHLFLSHYNLTGAREGEREREKERERERKRERVR